MPAKAHKRVEIQAAVIMSRSDTWCDNCGALRYVRVVDSRPTLDGRGRMRRRQCTSCNIRWTTHEVTMSLSQARAWNKELMATAELMRTLVPASDLVAILAKRLTDSIRYFSGDEKGHE